MICVTLILRLRIIRKMANEMQRAVWPRVVDEETLWLIDQCHDRYELELTRRHPRFSMWCQPNVDGEDRIRFYARNPDRLGRIPTRRVAENIVTVVKDYGDSHRGAIDMDYVANSGELICRLEMWDLDPPILLGVSGESPAISSYRLKYFYRNRFSVNSMVIAMLDR